MKRIHKTLELFDLLADEDFKNEDGYVPLKTLEERLSSKGRNIRDIISELKGTKYEIESKPGINGGYRFKKDLLKRHFGLSKNDIKALENYKVYNALDTLDPDLAKRVYNVFDKITGYTELEEAEKDPFYKIKLGLDLDYLEYMQQMKYFIFSGSIGLTGIFEGKYGSIVMKINYKAPWCQKYFKGIYISEMFDKEVVYADDHHYFVMLNVETYKLEFVDVKYIRNIGFEEHEEVWQYNMEKLRKLEADESIKAEAQAIMQKEFDKRYFRIDFPSTFEETYIKKMKEIIKPYCYIREDKNNKYIYYIRKTKLPVLMLKEMLMFEEVFAEENIHENDFIPQYFSIMSLENNKITFAGDDIV